MSPPVQVRMGVPADLGVVTRQFFTLWPHGPVAEHETEAASILSGHSPSTMPLAIFVAEIEGTVVGFIEVGLRSHADGCDPSVAVGFIEGWYVEPQHRRHGVGRVLVQAAEDWARSKGCRELGSDTWIDNEPSQRAHEAIGFEAVDRCVNYRKPLR